MKRSRLKATGRRSRRLRKQRAMFRAAVLERSRGYCDRCGTWHGDALHAHHYRPRSLGGSDDPRLPQRLADAVIAGASPHGTKIRLPAHPDGNGIALCGKCHEAAHARRGEAARWIDSTNRSLSLGRPQPGDGGPSLGIPKQILDQPPKHVYRPGAKPLAVAMLASLLMWAVIIAGIRSVLCLL